MGEGSGKGLDMVVQGCTMAGTKGWDEGFGRRVGAMGLGEGFGPSGGTKGFGPNSQSLVVSHIYITSENWGRVLVRVGHGCIGLRNGWDKGLGRRVWLKGWDEGFGPSVWIKCWYKGYRTK